MKIGILIDRLNVGGVEKIAMEQVIALRSIGVDAHLVVLREKAIVDNAFPDLIKNVPVIYLDRRLPKFLHISFGFPGFHFFSFFHISYSILLPFVIKEKEFDYLIAHGTYTCLTASTIKKFKSIGYSAFIWDPVSYILDRVYEKSFFKPLMSVLKKVASILDRYLINSMDSVLVGGPAHNDFIRQVNPHKSIHTIYPSVHPISRPIKKENYVLMVTAWKEGKNPEYIFEILKKMPELHIKMVGKWVDPEYHNWFERETARLKYVSCIDIVGAVSEKELERYYAKAQVLLQTNDDRGFGMPAMEAAGRGTTFIIPEGQGVCVLFQDGTDGYYTKERDTERIVQLLRKLLDDKKRAADMGTKAWRKVVANYSWDRHAQELMKVAKIYVK